MKRLRYVRLSAGRRAAIWGVFLLAAVMGLLCVAVLHMKPILTNLAAASVSNTVNRIVVTAVYDAVSAGEVDYDALVHLEKGSERPCGGGTQRHGRLQPPAKPHCRQHPPAAVGGVHTGAGDPRGNADRLLAAGGTWSLYPHPDAGRWLHHRQAPPTPLRRRASTRPSIRSCWMSPCR